MSGIGADILGVIAIGVAMAAVMYAGIHMARKAGLRVPPWLMPAGIGAAMVIYSVWNDYSWYERAVERLPAGTEVLMVGRTTQIWAPWTYVLPVAVRFAALDPSQVVDIEDQRRHAPIMLVERRGQTVIVPQDFDCRTRSIRPARGEWAPAAQDDPALAVVCRNQEG